MKKLLTIGILAAAVVATAQWPQYHGNAQRTGFTSQNAPGSLMLSWSADLGGPVVTSPIVGADGTIYVGPTPTESLVPSMVVTALYPDGTVKWRFNTRFVDADMPNLSTPAVDSNNVLYFGAPDGAFYALNADGTQKWKFQGDWPVLQSPVIAPDGNVYVSMDGKLTSFSPDGTVRWQIAISTLNLPGGPSIGPDGTIYAVGDDANGPLVYAFNSSGIMQWSVPVSTYFWPLAPPTVGPDGTIYTAVERLIAINPNGTIKWSVEPAFGINHYGSIAVDQSSNLYYSAYVYAWKLAPNGSVIWEYMHLQPGTNSLGSTYNGILVDGTGRLFMGLGTGKRSAIPYEKQVLVLTNGGSIQQTTPLPEIAGASSPALHQNGTLLIGSLDGRLYAYNAPGTQSIPPSSMENPTGTIESGNLASLASADGNALVLRGFSGGGNPPMSLILEGSVSSANPSMLKLQTKTMTDAKALDQKIEFYNWTTGTYELVRVDGLKPAYADFSGYASGSVARFVQPGTKKVRAKLSYLPSVRTNVRSFRAFIDLAIWKMVP